MKNTTDFERLRDLESKAEQYMNTTGDRKPWVVVMNACDNASDSGWTPGSEKYARHALLSLCESVCPRGDARDLIPLFQSWGFLA